MTAHKLLIRLVFIIIALLIAGITLVYYFRSTENKIIEVTIVHVIRYPHLEPFPFWASAQTPSEKTIVLERWQLTNSDEVWKNLQIGQRLYLHHHIEHWNVFGKVITLRHNDELKLEK